MVCGTADILMKFLSLDWFGLGYDCFCKRLHSRKLIKKAIPKEASTRCFLGLGFLSARMLGVEVLVCFIPPHPPRGTGVGGAGSGVVAHMLVVVVYEDQFGQNDSRQLARWYRRYSRI